MISPPELIAIDWDGRRVEIEYQWVGGDNAGDPVMIFLHEGLGSLAMWKDFPAQLCRASGCRGLVYSRPGYGQSTPRAADEHWAPDFMHRQARAVLPALMTALEIDASDSLWLFGHSDGGSIALLYAAEHPERVAGLVVVAPHIMVEELSVSSIEQARRAYRETDLKQKLGRYHDDPDSAFWGWNDIWLHPDFRAWSIENEIAAIDCPLLALQGLDDEYGTLEQIHGIARRLKQTEVVELIDCGHSPQRDQPQQLIAVTARFVQAAAAQANAEESGIYAQY